MIEKRGVTALRQAIETGYFCVTKSQRLIVSATSAIHPNCASVQK